MYFVHYYDYGTIAVRVGITKINEIVDPVEKEKLENIKNTLDVTVRDFEDMESAYGFIARLPSHCDFYCLKNAKGVHLWESDLCRLRRELSTEFLQYVRMTNAKLWPLFGSPGQQNLN
ncbi:hypothetical protein [Chitinophaga defluvii]|uniref:Uncharacterized protein n=1 Tax=Chitinophaga defluvii TaxID=3163343 RepID=A0ABV2TCE0_9BACT